ncbi:BTAD domain-containing putative transcriptional regulator [Nocardia sp. NPDC051030]|uniref:BTAD domain-containing putative transcriptional regulator n=1 Tax=Nocardia sp. NPDC051030 TaxID=3155162 RepID=UPI003430AFC3
MLRFKVLGTFDVTRGDDALEIRPRHREVLARLLIARGRAVPVDVLVGEMWPDTPPAKALGTLQTFVADLRRVLEPERAPRTPARILVSSPPGYALRIDNDAVDAWRFEQLVRGADDNADAPHESLARLDSALALWGRGRPYLSLNDIAWVGGEITRLTELWSRAVERRAELALRLGRAAEVVADLREYTADYPLREEGWRLLATGLYRSARQAEALDALRQARRTLADELGIDPGPGLRQLEADILAQAAYLAPDRVTRPESDRRSATTTHILDRVSRPNPESVSLVGRDEELAVLLAAAEDAAAGRLRVALITAEPGGGKTALAVELTQRLSADGWLPVWGRCPEDEGIPPGWPWTEILHGLIEAGFPPASEAARALAPLLDGVSVDGDAAIARFRMHRALADEIAAVAAHQPLLIMLDDLHRADAESLTMFARIAQERSDIRVLLVGAYRPHEEAPALTETIARIAPRAPVRLALTGLGLDAIAQIVTASVEVGESTLHAIAERTSGNPFFVQETARLLASDGTRSLSKVPTGVRDVILRRVALLPLDAQVLLHRATVLGREVDVEVLTAMAEGVCEDAVIDALENAVLLGLLEETSDGDLRFSHLLIRDTLYTTIFGLRRSRWHAQAAQAIEAVRPDNVTALAHHYLSAGAQWSDAAARYARAAAELAQTRFAHSDAARWWRAALEATDRAPGSDPRNRLELVMGLARALALSGAAMAAREHRIQALESAVALHDPALAAEVIAAFEVPVFWSDRGNYGIVADPMVQLMRQVLEELPLGDSSARCTVLINLSLELTSSGDGQAAGVAAAAEQMARRLDHPGYLVRALNARFHSEYHRAGLSAERTAIGAELLAVAQRHDLGIAAQALGYYFLMCGHAGVGAFDIAAGHAKALRELSIRFDLPQGVRMADLFHALWLQKQGRFAESECAYAAVADDFAEAGFWGVERSLRNYSRFSRLWTQNLWPQHMVADLVEELREFNEQTGNFGMKGWVHALALIESGRIEEARVVAERAELIRRDYLFEAQMGLVGTVGMALDRTDWVELAYRELLPAAGEDVGAGAGWMSLGPVSSFLDKFAAHLNEPAAVLIEH